MVKHRMRWYGRIADSPSEDWIPRNRMMAGGDWGWDVKCACGWESNTGGAIEASIKRDIANHLWDMGVGPLFLSCEAAQPATWTCTSVFRHPQTGWVGIWTKPGSKNAIHHRIVAFGPRWGPNGSTQLTREEALEAAQAMVVSW